MKLEITPFIQHVIDKHKDVIHSTTRTYETIYEIYKLTTKFYASEYKDITSVFEIIKLISELIYHENLVKINEITDAKIYSVIYIPTLLLDSNTGVSEQTNKGYCTALYCMIQVMHCVYMKVPEEKRLELFKENF